MASSSDASSSSDGPVLSLITKRLRALKKKYNRILQMEETLALGKPLNAEQQEVLRSKHSVSLLIDEYEKLRQPLAVAVQEELSRLPPPTKSDEPPAAAAAPPAAVDATSVEDIVTLLYFGSLFDVKQYSEFTAMMLTKTHERNCCLTYDYVTDDATELLGEKDLDSISALGSLVTSRFGKVSHKSALEGCVEHAKLWLENSELPISPGAGITYAGLREKLKKILASDFFTTTAEIRDTDFVAASVGYGAGAPSQVNVADGSEVPSTEHETTEIADYEQEVQEERDFQGIEHSPDTQLKPADATKVEQEELSSFGEAASATQEQHKYEADVEEHDQRDLETKDQHYSRGSYQNQRGGYRGNTRGGRRGYSNGRGGRGGNRGGNGVYQNGRNQYNDQGYHPRAYSRGRGGRTGGSGAYYNQGGNYGNYAPSAVELTGA